MIKAVIIDDEKNNRNTLKNYIKDYCPDVAIVDEAEGVKTGIETLANHYPELVFLDIRMNDGTGFELLEKIEDIDFKVIFTTAYDEYALKAFKYSAVDYLLKPIDPDELVSAVNKVRQDQKADLINKLGVLMNNEKNTESRLTISNADGNHFISTSDIICCEADNVYTTFYLRNGEKLVTSKSINEFEELLIDKGFFRSHKSHLVNRVHVKKFVKADGGAIEMTDGVQVPLARRKKDLFFEWMNN